MKGVEPEPLWAFFEALSTIPRPSKQEEKVVAWLKGVADERGLEWQQDSVGNLLIRRPGSGGGENAPIVVLQVRPEIAGLLHGARFSLTVSKGWRERYPYESAFHTSYQSSL